jgi:outer membrane lipoprotein carrier protein
MRKCLAGIAVAAIVLVPFQVGAEDGTARVERYLDGLTSLTAHFSQVLLDPDGKTVQSADGTLEIKRPGRFRWDYAPPHEQTVVADGSRLWLYDPALEQVTVKALDETLGSTPAMLLSGNAKVSDGYKSVREYDADGLRWVELEPRAAGGDFPLVRLAFAGDELKRMELTDTLDQVTRIELSDVDRNAPVDDARFGFTPPPGTDVVGDAPAAGSAP